MRSISLDEMNRPTKLAHVVLRVPDLEACVDWYETVLGARPVFQNSFVAFLTYDDEHHRIAFVCDPESTPPPPRTSGLEHVAFTYAGLGELLQTYQRLERAGIEPYWCINHGPTTSFYYRDPAGNQVELQHDNYPTEEELKAWFATGAFAENPIGVTFDPKKLVARWERGDAIEELIQQGSAS
jgi:catechol-2,3-dioxygenase